MVEHARAFEEFCRWELASGGPDPHMRVAEWLARRHEQPAWICGLYVAGYVVPTVEAVTHFWPTADSMLTRPGDFETWVAQHWAGLPIRKERKVNGMGPRQFVEFVRGYALWLERYGGHTGLAEEPTFDAAFGRLVGEVRGVGRYFGMKLYEVLRRTTGVPTYPFTDIRPKHGRLSRKTLELLYPEHDARANTPVALEDANLLARAEGLRLKAAGIPLDWFKLEVMLCNYRQAVAGAQYPGRALDSELGHLRKVEEYWGGAIPFRTLEARVELFPHECLGELGGWDGRRKELGTCLSEHGYTWSDALYLWEQSSYDLAHPVSRP